MNSHVLVMRQLNMSPVVPHSNQLRGGNFFGQCGVQKETLNIPAITSGPWKCSSGCI